MNINIIFFDEIFDYNELKKLIYDYYFNFNTLQEVLKELFDNIKEEKTPKLFDFKKDLELNNKNNSLTHIKIAYNNLEKSNIDPTKNSRDIKKNIILGKEYGEDINFNNFCNFSRHPSFSLNKKDDEDTNEIETNFIW